MTESKPLMSLIAQLGMRSGLARRFVAGQKMNEAIAVVGRLNNSGILASLNLLGEEVGNQKEAEDATQRYIDLLKAIHTNQVQSNISVKLTQLGLGIDVQVCAAHLKAILETARRLDNFVRIDMEASRYTERTIDLFREHFATYRNHVGVAIQAYLYRSEEDIRRLSELECNIRLVKGAYMEPRAIAFPKKADVDRNFVKLVEKLLLSSSYVAIATHDTKMIEHAQHFTARHEISPARYEFQMIYGIGREAQKQISQQGYAMRVYVPFGTHWAPYLVRRLAERPANVFFLLKHLFRI